MAKTFSIVFLFITSVSYSQQMDYRMKIRVSEDGSGKRFELAIDREDQGANFYFAQYDSTSSKWAEKDKHLYSKLLRDFYKNGEMPYDHSRIIEGLNRKYEYYTKDSISIPATHPFIIVTDSVAIATSDALKRFEENKELQTVKGYQFTLDIYSQERWRKINLRNPSIQSHPLIFRLLSGMLEVYRNGDPKVLITKKDTFGY